MTVERVGTRAVLELAKTDQRDPLPATWWARYETGITNTGTGPSGPVWLTDTIPSAATVELARGSDLLIHEASFSAVLQPGVDPSVNFHSTARQAGEIARRAGCPRLALVHMGPQISEHPDVLVEEARADSDLQVIVPEDGQRMSINKK